MTTTNVLAMVHFAAQPPDLYLATATDGTAKELVSQAAGASLGDVAGQTVTWITVQASDGSVLDNIEILDAAGGQLIQVLGGERGGSTSSKDANFNIDVLNIALPVKRGMVLNALTAD
jgi:hypothetical protein